MAQHDAGSGRYKVSPSEKGDIRSFDDPMEAAKYLRSFRVKGAAVELFVNGRTPTTEQAAPINEALEHLNDQLPKFLIFKDEDDCDGVPIGPVSVGPDPEQVVLYGEAAFVGEPYRPRCFCNEPGGKPGETCSECGREVPEPWLTLPEAEAKARELGIEVRQT